MNLALHTRKEESNPPCDTVVRSTKSESSIHRPYHDTAVPRKDQVSPLHLLFEDLQRWYIGRRSAPDSSKDCKVERENQRYLGVENRNQNGNIHHPQPLKPKPTPAKPREKKRKLVMDTTEALSPAKRSKAGKVVKKATLKSSNSWRASKDAYPSTSVSTSIGVIIELNLKNEPHPRDRKGERETKQNLIMRHLVEGQARSDPRKTIRSQENLKIQTECEVRLKEPASSVETLSSMQNLDKELSFTNQFIAEKSQEDEPEKTNTEVEVQSMVTVPIHQDTLSVPLMTSPIIDITVSQPASTTVHASQPISTATTSIMTTTTLPSPPPQP
ncbi:hypothetical protein Tco_0008824 [Tanacetum coccineum]